MPTRPASSARDPPQGRSKDKAEECGDDADAGPLRRRTPGDRPSSSGPWLRSLRGSRRSLLGNRSLPRRLVSGQRGCRLGSAGAGPGARGVSRPLRRTRSFAGGEHGLVERVRDVLRRDSESLRRCHRSRFRGRLGRYRPGCPVRSQVGVLRYAHRGTGRMDRPRGLEVGGVVGVQLEIRPSRRSEQLSRPSSAMGLR